MAERYHMENIIRNYFIIPWQPRVNITKILEESSESLNYFIQRQIIPEVFIFLKDRETVSKENKKREYIDQLSKCLVEAKYLKIEKSVPEPPKKKKKFSYKEYMADMKGVKKTDEEYRKEQKEKLTRELIPCIVNKLDVI